MMIIIILRELCFLIKRGMFPSLFSSRVLSVEQCSAVLQSAENDVLTNILNLMGDWRYVREMTREQELMLVYFLEALVMLSFLQEPEVVKKMTVSDLVSVTMNSSTFTEDKINLLFFH